MSKRRKSSAPSQSYENFVQKREVLLAEARALAAHCNSLVPIAKLPDEILILIFHINVPQEMSFISTRRRSNYPKDISKETRTMSQVCQYWRQLILVTPKLWDLVLDCSTMVPKWTQELMAYSGTLPLKFSMNLSSRGVKRHTENFAMLSSQSHRVGYLEVISGSRKKVEENVFKNLKNPMPMLHSLSLTQTEDNTYGQRMLKEYDSSSDSTEFETFLYTSAIASVFLPEFPHVDACQLQHLKMSRYIFPLDSPAYQHLTKLAIWNIVPAANAPKVADWCALLQRLENLTSLEFVRTFLKADTPEILPDIHLPRLTSLMLRGRLKPCALFLEHLHTPPLESFHTLLSDIQHPVNAMLQRVLAKILDHLTRQKQHGLPQALRAVLSKSYLRIINLDPSKTSNIDFGVQLDIAVSTPQSSSNFVLDSLTALVDSPDSADQMVNEDHQYPPIMVQALIALLTPYTSMDKLHISLHCASVYIAPLFSHCRGQTQYGSDASPYMLPIALLQIKNIVIEHMLSFQPTGVWDTLKAFLVWRESTGFPLGALRFKCDFYHRPDVRRVMPEQATALMPHCGKLVWETNHVPSWFQDNLGGEEEAFANEADDLEADPVSDYEEWTDEEF